MRHLSVLAAAALLAGCAAPYSQISGGRYFQAPIDTYPVDILEIDGKHPTHDPARVQPGVHEVKVRAVPTPAQYAGTARTHTLEVKPCTRYYLVAVKPTRLQPDFTVKVDHEEPVPGCSTTR